jgi:hypothetical protein
MLAANMSLFINLLFIYYFLLSACSGSMPEASCGLCQYQFFIYYYLLIFYLVFAAAACVKHPAGYANIISLFIIYYLFSACSSSIREESCA